MKNVCVKVFDEEGNLSLTLTNVNFNFIEELISKHVEDKTTNKPWKLKK